MVRYTFFLSSDALLKYFSTFPSDTASGAPVPSTSAQHSDTASGLKAAQTDPADVTDGIVRFTSSSAEVAE